MHSLDDGSASRPMRPVAETERNMALDALRGTALLGIFFVNIQYFALPLMEAIGHVGLADAPTDEKVAWAFMKLLCELKFISLFSLLFGAGMVVLMTRAHAARGSFVAVYLRRMAVLALFGAVHAFGLWYGDILLIYAVAGTLLLFLRGLKPRTMFTVAAIMAGFTTVLTTGCFSLQIMGAQAKHAQLAELETTADHSDDVAVAALDESAADIGTDSGTETGTAPMSAWDAIQTAQFDPARPGFVEAECRAYATGPWAEAMVFRTYSYTMMAVAGIFGFGWRVMAMFLIGAGLMKIRFFEADQRAVQKRLCLIGLAVGLPLEAGAVVITWSNDFSLSMIMLVAQTLHETGSLALCLGYAGGICMLAHSRIGRTLLYPIAQTGRLALSVYLLETICATGLMYWWGLGWFGDVSRPQQFAIVVAIYAGLTVFAMLWLRWFRMGPFEWIWRSLSYGYPQPIRRAVAG